MVQALQPALYTLLNVSSVTNLLGTPAVIKAASDFDADGDAVPAILLMSAGGRKTTLPQFYEDWFVYVLDRNNGYYRIDGVRGAAKRVLDGAQPNLSGTDKVFQIDWLSSLPWDTSRTFRAEVGGDIYRVYLSKD